MAAVAVLMVLATSCGINVDTKPSSDEIGKFLFVEIDKSMTEFCFLFVGVILVVYWAFFFWYKRSFVKKSEEILENILGHERKFSMVNSHSLFIEEVEKEIEAYPDDTFVRMVLFAIKGAKTICLAMPILVFYSWIIPTRGILYWALCIATFLAFKFIPGRLGIDTRKISIIWMYIWTVITLIVNIWMFFD